MENRLLVAELKAATPGAAKAIYDSYGRGLFSYCWFMLRNADAAQVAVRDSLIVAEAHIAKLTEPELLRPWLYALARVECLRRRPSPASEPDPDLPGPGRPGTDAGLMAWHAVMDLGPLEREALELATRQRLAVGEAGLVLGISPRETELLQGRARASLQRALTGEILARASADGCPDRAAILAETGSTLTTPVREALVTHSGRCAACAQHMPRNVSATKVYSLLPVPRPPEQLRLRALGCFEDPELAGYRAFVAGRAATFGPTGFPETSAAAVAAAVAAEPRRQTTAHLWVGLAAAIAAAGLGVGLAVSHLGGFDATIRHRQPGSARPVGSALPGAPTAPASAPGSSSSAARARVQVGQPVTPTTPLGVAGNGGTAPGPAQLVFPSHPARWPLRGAAAAPPAGGLQVTPRLLELGAASSGKLTLSATGGQVTWSASTSSQQLALSAYQGSLPAGGEITLIVTLARKPGSHGQASVLIGPGNLSVLVAAAAMSPSPAARPAASTPASASAPPPIPPTVSPAAPQPAPPPAAPSGPASAPQQRPPAQRYPPGPGGPDGQAPGAAPPAPEPPWMGRGQEEPWRHDDGQPWERHGWHHWGEYQWPPWP
jgi:DNA-directed RNA polymerase specialized sigma24 family protein